MPDALPPAFGDRRLRRAQQDPGGSRVIGFTVSHQAGPQPDRLVGLQPDHHTEPHPDHHTGLHPDHLAGLRPGRRAGRRLRLVAGLLAVGTMLGAAGCGDLQEANAAGGTQADLVSAMAAQLAGGSALSYTATYQVTGGGTATVTRAQRPARTAYVYPGGRLLVTTTATTRCRGDDRAPVCTRTPADPTAAATLEGTALVTAEAVLAMLNTAALDPDASANQHDTTIAGRHATCLDLHGVDRTPARDFTVCVTSEGALASFAATGTGTRVDQALTSYSDQVTGAAFELPPAAKVTGSHSP